MEVSLTCSKKIKMFVQAISNLWNLTYIAHFIQEKKWLNFCSEKFSVKNSILRRREKGWQL